jgi:hypothetical protein
MSTPSARCQWHTWIGVGLAIRVIFLVTGFGVTPVRAQAPGVLAIPADDFEVNGDSQDDALIKGAVAVRSAGGQLARRLETAIQNGIVPIPGSSTEGKNDSNNDNRRDDFDTNKQVNNPALDHTVTFPGTRPYEFSTESETSVVANGKHIVVGYNSSANVVVKQFPQGLMLTQVFFTAYSVSHDGGSTWRSGFVPPVAPSSPFTFGDPALAMDRDGNIFYASLGSDAGGHSAVIINKSSDNGNTFAAARVVAVDPGSDKEWLAIGPDPVLRRDNLYVTWTSFYPGGSRLMLARSIDGGVTWSSKVLFAPVDDGLNSSFIQASNPVVDASTGRLYVPFLHFSDVDADNVRVLASDDGGQTFQLLAFNVPGAPDAFAYPNVTPGVLNDCGTGGIRNVLHQGASVGVGRFGTFRYVYATRLITQPAAAAFRGRLLIALQSSTSPIFGDPAAGSEIKGLYSQDGGGSWSAPVRIAVSTASDPQHVHPAIALGQNGNRAWATYYVQQADGRLRTDAATIHIDGNHLRVDSTTGLSTQSFDLTPSNIPFPTPTNRFQTTNYDRIIAHCYDIGEYMSVAVADNPGEAVAAWGDNRNPWTGRPGSAAPFTHAQPDVFFGRIDN